MVTVTETCSKLYNIEYIDVFLTERLFGYKQIFAFGNFVTKGPKHEFVVLSQKRTAIANFASRIAMSMATC
jgi:hypothetical protein